MSTSRIAMIALLLASCPIMAVAEDTPPAGFQPLFNGRDLEGWQAIPHYDHRKLAAMEAAEREKLLAGWQEEAEQHWTVDDGELVNDGKGPYLTTNQRYGDMELLLEYKTAASADSGIYLRGTPQVQIWDFTKEGGKWNRGADLGSGGLFNNSPGSPARDPLLLADRPFGEWNMFRIVQVGARTTVYLNGQLVVDNQPMHNYWDRSRPLFPLGPIQLQTHGGEIRWRNIFIREISIPAANELLAKQDAAQFQSLFNGKDLAGWQGDTDAYEVSDGAIACRAGSGGNLFTEDEYADFVVRLEFKLPPGGNNGLAIRYPGSGGPHVSGMCEIQVLDSEHPKYASLDPRQYHGSAYGIAAAHRGYLRETGQWNYQQVTVRGSTIEVELNGYTILSTDVSEVTEFKDGAAPTGFKRTTGFFGFAGHGDPVAFRNISIRRLPPVSLAENSWPQFRGQNSSGRAGWGGGYPTELGPEKNVVWKVPLASGHSSPIVIGDSIVLTGQQDDKLQTICLARKDGSVKWVAEAPYKELEAIHQIGSHAQSSPASDGERVVSFFGSSGLYCYDMDGELLWKKPMGPFNNDFGAGTSPIISADQVILCQDHDTGSFLVSIDKRTGETNWEVDRSEFPRNYCSPVIWTVNGKKQIVVAATLRVVGYDFETGEEVWTVHGISRCVCMTPVIGDRNKLFLAGWARGGDEGERIVVDTFADVLKARDTNNNGLVERSELEKGGAIERRFSQVDRDKSGTLTGKEYEYFRGLFDTARNVLMAIEPGGTGDVTESHVSWEFRKFLPFCSSPLTYNGYVFTVKDGGILTSLNARTGQPLKTARISGSGAYYSSPVAADGRVYLVDQRGRLTVVSAWAEWKELAKADFEEEVYATPALLDGRIYLRTSGHLYCFGSQP